MPSLARTETVAGTCAALLGVVGVGAGLGGLGGWVVLVGALTVLVGALLVLVGWWPSRADVEAGPAQWPGTETATDPADRSQPGPSEPGTAVPGGPDPLESGPDRPE